MIEISAPIEVSNKEKGIEISVMQLVETRYKIIESDEDSNMQFY